MKRTPLEEGVTEEQEVKRVVKEEMGADGETGGGKGDGTGV